MRSRTIFLVLVASALQFASADDNRAKSLFCDKADLKGDCKTLNYPLDATNKPGRCIAYAADGNKGKQGSSLTVLQDNIQCAYWLDDPNCNGTEVIFIGKGLGDSPTKDKEKGKIKYPVLQLNTDKMKGKQLQSGACWITGSFDDKIDVKLNIKT